MLCYIFIAFSIPRSKIHSIVLHEYSVNSAATVCSPSSLPDLSASWQVYASLDLYISFFINNNRPNNLYLISRILWSQWIKKDAPMLKLRNINYRESLISCICLSKAERHQQIRYVQHCMSEAIVLRYESEKLAPGHKFIIKFNSLSDKQNAKF